MFDRMRNHQRNVPALAACLAAILSPLPALAAAPGAAGVSLSPLCASKSGAVLFFLERTDDCDGAKRQCRRNRWAYATLDLAGNGWKLEPLGEASLDEEASPEKNLEVSRQTFAAPASLTCATLFRAPKLPSPDLAFSEAWFQYSIETGALAVHWQGEREVISPDVKLWRLNWCSKGCGAAGESPRAEALQLKPELTVVETKLAQDGKASNVTAALLPTIDLSLGTDALLGFSEPARQGSGHKERGFIVARVSQERLRRAQANLLHHDAQRVLEKAAGDLFATSRAAGLLDAALQLDPSNAETRFDYARLFAMQGDARAAVRELEQIKQSPGLRAKLEKDPVMKPLGSNEAFRTLLESLPK
jgi:hypothetical protein